MPILDKFERLPVESILIKRDERQRREIDTSSIDGSIRRRGVLHPILVDLDEAGHTVLIAGERRLESSRKLGLPDIPIRWAADLSPVERKIIEYEENLKRQDLPWQDFALATASLHSCYLELDVGWTMTETAEEIGLGLSVVSMLLRVAEEMPRVREATTYREAYNVLARRDAREQGNAIEELLGVAPAPFPGASTGAEDSSASPGYITLGNGQASPTGVAPAATPVPAPCILNESFLTWAPGYSGAKFNFLHCDFPFGTAMTGTQAKGSEEKEAGKSVYSDSLETYLSLLDCLVENLPRFASLSCHIIFWTSSRVLHPRSRYGLETWSRLQRTPFEFWPYPLIWHKSDNAGVISDARRGPRHTYEVALFGSTNSRQIAKTVADLYSAPSDRRLHPSAKPEPMLRHFFQMTVDETTSMLDPTCGAGSALRAADSLGAARVLGLEIDPDHVKTAETAFRNARLLRSASELTQ